MPLLSHLLQLAGALTVLLAAFWMRNRLVRVLLKGLRLLLKQIEPNWENLDLSALEAPLRQIVVALLIYAGIGLIPLTLGTEASSWIFRVWSLCFLGVGWALCYRLVDLSIAALEARYAKTHPRILGFLPLGKRGLRIALLGALGLIGLALLGYSISTVVASMGIGLGAFAFAAKDTIAQLYNAFSMAMDPPFVVGDSIEIRPDIAGSVESIGLRSTRIRAADKTILVVPTNFLSTAVIHNHSAAPQRRVQLRLSLGHEASLQQIQALSQRLKSLFMTDEYVTPSEVNVQLDPFGQQGPELSLSYFIERTPTVDYTQIRHQHNLKIMEMVKNEGLAPALPTFAVHLAPPCVLLTPPSA